MIRVSGNRRQTAITQTVSFSRSPLPPRRTVLRTIGLLVLLVACSGSICADDDGGTTDWFVIRLGNQTAGYEQIRRTQAAETGQILIVRRTVMKLNRIGQDLSVTAALWTRQQPDGTLLHFRMQRTDGSGSQTERSGDYLPGKEVFRVNERVAGTRRQFDVRLNNPAYSPVVDSWLPHHLPTIRNSQTFPVLYPETARVARVTVSPPRRRTIRAIDGSGKLQVSEISWAPQLEPSKRTTLFIDDSQRVVRSEQSLLGSRLTLDRSDSATALSSVSEKSLNLDVMAPIPVQSILKPGSDQRLLVLEITVREGFLPDIPETEFQKVERLDESTARLMLTRPDESSIGRIPMRNTSGLIPDSLWMPLHDVRLQRMATTAAAGETNPVKVCRRLETFVRSSMKMSPFSTSLVPAAEVAQSLRGDCTEHAVLLAALIRQRGIPARIASGLVHSHSHFGFVGHTWVEARIGNLWLPLDSAAGVAGRPATHIKLADSDLTNPGQDSLALFVPVLNLAGQAEIVVVSSQ